MNHRHKCHLNRDGLHVTAFFMLICGGIVSKKWAVVDYRLNTLPHLFQKAKPRSCSKLTLVALWLTGGILPNPTMWLAPYISFWEPDGVLKIELAERGDSNPTSSPGFIGENWQAH
jgi:hypothetical protein